MISRAEETLRGTLLARFVPAHQFALLLERFEEVRYAFGDIIIRQGEEADAFFVLVTGRARVLKEQPNGEEVTLFRLQPGDEFGESALLQKGPRTSTVRCSTAVEALRLGRDKFQELVAEYPDFLHALELLSRWRSLHSFLYTYSHFGRLSVPALSALMSRLNPVDFKKGTRIIQEGEPAGSMYIVREGQLRVFTGKETRIVNVAFLREGDYFGERSVLAGEPRGATVEAFSDCRLLALRPEDVNEIRRQFPEFERLLAERLALYNAHKEARVPLDFSQELLPAEARRDPVATATTENESEEPFADERGFFRNRKRVIHRFHFVQQVDEMDCGAACLAMVCHHFGRKPNLARIRELCHVSSDGTSLQGMCSAAIELGLAARAVKASHRNLDRMPMPAIAHWDGRHWVVVYQVSEREVRLADPAIGLRKIQREEFEAKWSGYVALFDYTDAFEKAPEGVSSPGWVWPFFNRYRQVFLQALLLAGVASSLQLLLPIATQVVVDKVIVDREVELLHQIFIGMGVALAALVGSNLLQQYLLAFATVRIDAAVLDYLTRRLLDLPMSYFHSRRTGDIQRRLDGAREIRQFVVQYGVGSLLAAVQFLGCTTLMFMYSRPLALVFASTLPLYAGLMWFSQKVLRPLFAEMEENHARYVKTRATWEEFESI